MKIVKHIIETDIAKLSVISESVDLNNKTEMETLNNVLLRAYESLNGACLGISAIQLGIPKRAILLRYAKGKPIVVYNPEVKVKLGSRKSNEGCLSEGKHRYIVTRPIIAIVSYYDINGNKVNKILSYKRLRIFMHEVDHLNGILLQTKGVQVKEMKRWR